MIYADVQSVLQLKHRQRSGQVGTHCFLVADSDGRVCLRRPLQGDRKSSLEPIVDLCMQVSSKLYGSSRELEGGDVTVSK